MTKMDKANLVNEVIARNPYAVKVEAKAHFVEGSLFYTVKKNGREKFVKFMDVLMLLDGADARLLKGVSL